MVKRMFIDPPSGYKYGFPKVLPRELEGAPIGFLGDWLVSEGYPDYLLKYIGYTSYFIDKVEDKKQLELDYNGSTD